MPIPFLKPTPLLILGDAPDLGTGLSRIGKDLASLLSYMPEFRVGYLGRGGQPSIRYPWMQYNFPPTDQWGEELLERTWKDFAGEERGVVLTVWDASRLLWLADPVGLRNEPWLRNPPFELWGYFMQDAEGVNRGQLPFIHAHVMSRFKRILLASKWAYDLTRATFEHTDCDWLPHGINLSVFRPTDMSDSTRLVTRKHVFDTKLDKVWGCVMTNQARKHWPTVLRALKLSPGVFLWAHTDQVLGYWNLVALAYELGVSDRVLFDMFQRTDPDMAYFYSLCDVTLLISGGEGFGYPIAESLACGVPVVNGGYGAGTELNEYRNNLEPEWVTCETQHNVVHAHYSGRLVAQTCSMVDPVSSGEMEHLDWSNIGVQWKKWFRKGVAI